MHIKIAWQDLYKKSIAWVGNYRLSINKQENTENVFSVYVDLLWPDGHYTQIFMDRNEANTLDYGKQIAEQQLLIALHSGFRDNR